MKDKILAFAALVETETIQRLHEDQLACQGNIDNAKTHIHEGKKYTRVDIGSSGRFMVENATGNIFGIKGYGVIHKGHFYGTLDETAQWFWGGFYPKKKDGTIGTQARNGCPALTFAPAPVAPV